MANGYFSTGTPVHTPSGLVPIESVRVGDVVLSRDFASGATTQGRIARTHASPDQELLIVRFHKDGPGDDSMLIDTLGTTAGQTFYLKDAEWLTANALDNGDRLELYDRSHGRVICSERLHTTNEPGIGWAIGVWGTRLNDGAGNSVDLRSHRPDVALEESFNWPALADRDGTVYRALVFGLEVEDFHSFFVGTLGAWVHDLDS